MAHPTGESIQGLSQLDFDRGLKLEFHGRRAPRRQLLLDPHYGQADQDRREGRQPRPLCRLPNGRGLSDYLNPPGTPLVTPR